MIRRLVLAIVGTTSLAVVGFGIPLGIAVARLYRDEAVAKLERDAAASVSEVSAPMSPRDLPELPAQTDGTRVAVYDPKGQRVAGTGPDTAEDLVRSAAAGPLSSDDLNGSFVVAVPVGNDENPVGVVRAALPQRIVTDRIHHAWLAMGGLAIAIIGVAAVVAQWQARRLSRPVLELARSVDRLGQRDFAVQTSRSGIPELDAAAAAVDATARRLGELMERERTFSAHASHQLRTPLAGLRVQLEAAAIAPEGDLRSAMTEALASVDRLQQTIDDLLLLARDAPPTGPAADLRELFSEIEDRWHGVLAKTGRPLRISMNGDPTHITASAAAVRQILDVLVTNAEEHGAGVITVTARNTGGVSAIEVSDEGEGIPDGTRDVFAARVDSTPGRGIGLGLARALAEAEGGRLLLTHHGPSPTFRLLLTTDLSESVGR